MKLYRDLWIRDGYLYRTKGETKISNDPATGFKIIGPNGNYQIILEHPLGGRVLVGIHNFFNYLKKYSSDKEILGGEYVIVENYNAFQLLSIDDEEYQQVLLELETDEQREKVKARGIERNSFYKVKYRNFEKELLYVGELFVVFKSYIYARYNYVNGRSIMTEASHYSAKQGKQFVFFDEENDRLYFLDKLPQNIFSSGKMSHYQSSAQLLRDVSEKVSEKDLIIDTYQFKSIGMNEQVIHVSLTKLSDERIQELVPDATEILHAAV